MGRIMSEGQVRMSGGLYVECYSGYAYAQEPRVVVRDGKRYPVRRVLRRWLEPGGPCFEVDVDNAGDMTICYDELLDRWYGL